MRYPYAFLHLVCTLPPAVLLHFLLSPVRSRRDVFKITLLSIIAVISTTPWDSYLIRSKIWSYPPGSVLGTVLSVPLEEYFFFVVQTYITATLYLLLAKPVIHMMYLNPHTDNCTLHVDVSCSVIITGIGLWMLSQGHEFRYFGLILTWTGPFLTLLTSLSGAYLSALPLHVTCGSIILPTVYLWFVDSMALRDGTWIIAKGTKIDWQLWGALDIEEAVFFLATNTMITLGLVTIDYCFAHMDAFPQRFPQVQSTPSIGTIWKAVFLRYSPHDSRHLEHLRDACLVLKRQSGSFYIASLVFPGRCRSYLLSLYAFCRVIDDLIDDAPDVEAAQHALRVARDAINRVYFDANCNHAPEPIPPQATAPFALLPMFTSFIPPTPFLDLLAGFESDLAFFQGTSDLAHFPIQTETDLITYCERVSSTVAHMFVYTVWHCETVTTVKSDKEKTLVLSCATQMGVALQLVNIARDIVEDAQNGRTYIPVVWFNDAGEMDCLEALLRDPHDRTLDSMLSRYALRLVGLAQSYYTRARPGLEHFPRESRKGTMLAIENYMDIGREIERKHGDVRTRIVVGKGKKLRTVLKVLYG